MFIIIYYDKFFNENYLCNYAKIYIPIFETNHSYNSIIPYFIIDKFNEIFSSKILCDINIKYKKMNIYNTIIIELTFAKEYSKYKGEKLINSIINYLQNISSISNYNKFEYYIYKSNENKKRELYDNFAYSNYLYHNYIFNENKLDNNKNKIIDRLKSIEVSPIYVFYFGSEKSCFRLEKDCLEPKLIYNYSELASKNITLVRGYGNSIYFSASNINCSFRSITLSAFSTLFSMLLYDSLRDKMGLAYYAGSEFDNLNSKFIIRVGTYSSDYFPLIHETINNIKNNIVNEEINENYLRRVKYSKINELLAVEDDPFLFISYIYENLITGVKINFNNEIEKIRSLHMRDFSLIAENLDFIFNIQICGRVEK